MNAQLLQSQGNTSAEAQAQHCDMEGRMHLIFAIDAFKMSSRYNLKFVGAYAGMGGKMAVLGLGLGGDDYVNVKSCFGTDTPNQRSLLSVLESLIHDGRVVLKLPSYMEEQLADKQVLIELKWTLLFDQPAQHVLLGLGKMPS